jgi:hypothetical protein
MPLAEDQNMIQALASTRLIRGERDIRYATDHADLRNLTLTPK